MLVYDVVIVGGGPAGLNAVVVLGRCRRKVLLFDKGTQRNLASNGLRNCLTRDNISPRDFFKLAHGEIKKYGVVVKRAEIVHAKKLPTDIFLVKDEKGLNYYSKKLLLTTGLNDNIPPIKGIDNFYGKSIFHCPYCDGWEVKEKLIGVYTKNKNGFELAVALKTWSKHVTLYTDKRHYLKPQEIDVQKKKNIRVVSEKITSVEGATGKVSNIVFANNKKERCDALFL